MRMSNLSQSSGSSSCCRTRVLSRCSLLGPYRVMYFQRLPVVLEIAQVYIRRFYFCRREATITRTAFFPREAYNGTSTYFVRLRCHFVIPLNDCGGAPVASKSHSTQSTNASN